MKQIIVAILVILLLAGPGTAEIILGINGGPVVYLVSGAEGENVEVKRVVRPSFGCFAFYSIFAQWAIQLQLLYLVKAFEKVLTNEGGVSAKGGLHYLNNMSSESTEKASLGYLQIPVLLRYEIPTQSKLKPRLMAGPSFAINVSGKDEASGFGEWDGEHDISNLKKLDISGMIGAGVSYPLKNVTIGFDIFYDRSFGSAFKDVTQEELANDTEYEFWTENDPVTFERTTKAVDFKNSGFVFQFSVELPFRGTK